MSDKGRAQKQIELAERLQDGLLLYFEKKLDEGSLTDTGAATLARLLSSNGWSLDPTRLPQGVADKLTRRIDPSQFDEGDDLAIAGAIIRR